MPRRKNKFPTCPSCHSPRYKTELEQVMNSMTAVDRKAYPNIKTSKEESYTSFIDANFDWACDPCLIGKRAILANPNSQTYCWNPHYAYFDTTIECHKCNNKFTFSKEEKKYWYENLKFWIESVPINCVDCRKATRKLKKENKILSDIIMKEEAKLTIEELKNIIDIYATWGKTERSKYFNSVLKRKLK